MTGDILTVEDLTVRLRTDDGWIDAVEHVSLAVGPRECLGIVGESGSGKSVTALSILRLHNPPTTRYPSGKIMYGGRDLLALPERELRRLRGGEIAMIFQDPMSSLNPVLTIVDQIVETIRQHETISAANARRRAVELLDLVRIPDAARRVDDYPHRLSGGMRQRVMIAMAIACRPKLLIADEPTTALDVTIQSQILELLRDLSAELGMSMILITHDMGVVAQFAHRVAVMYGGEIIETAPAARIFERPLHPYTQGLLSAIPKLEGAAGRLLAIPGTIPDPAERPPGCRFYPRCGERIGECATTHPVLEPVAPQQASRCPPRLANRVRP